ncbi:17976_t:CDS:2 [Funneliformis geosporum]|nr:17976_t:CDS:2 [Funneliformis geosporum]
MVNFIDLKLLELYDDILKFFFKDDDRQEQNIESDDQQEQVDDDALDYTIEVEEFAFKHHDYNLHTSKSDQTLSIDVRSILIWKLPQFSNAAYSEFIELISTYHLSDSAGNDILKWFHRYHLWENIILPTNTTQGHEFVNSIDVNHLLYLKTKILTYENEEYYLHHCSIFDAIKELLSNADILKYYQ